MLKFGVPSMTAAAVIGIAVFPGTALAAPLGPAALAYSVLDAPSGGDPATTVTFEVTTGALSMTAPESVDLGSGAPHTTISGALGDIVVTDDRALLSATWNVSASSTAWTTGAGTADETIPAADATYDPGTITKTGTITATGTIRTLAGGAQTVVAGTAGVGDNTATWNPTIAVAVPASAVGGIYSATLTQSVT